MFTGVSIAIVGILIVFLSLVLLYFCMKLFIFLLEYSRDKHENIMKRVSISGRTGKENISEEVVTAIAMAIQMSREEYHDIEKTIITLNRITKPYSPWSSKIHGIRKSPHSNI
ncbi:hypothetical protein GF337_07770 [candidate division KSB1 bacterium]|nr:hypothetical protein [candidate division KSB1 bacterium]